MTGRREAALASIACAAVRKLFANDHALEAAEAQAAIVLGDVRVLFGQREAEQITFPFIPISRRAAIATSPL